MNLYVSAWTMTKRALALGGFALERRRPFRDPIAHIAAKMAERRIETLVDVGANFGQFAGAVRREGYAGDIYSFEPLTAAHATCAAAAARDPRWTLMPRMALGATRHETEINIALNMASSSLLDVEEKSVNVAPESGVSGKETIQVHPLDAVAGADWKRPIALKIDTQGFEQEVLAGAAQTLLQTEIILVEMSLVPLYRGAPTLPDLYNYITQRGFACIGLTQGFADLARNELLQVDGLFIRQR
jgi:FkbM family methyltransferase